MAESRLPLGIFCCKVRASPSPVPKCEGPGPPSSWFGKGTGDQCHPPTTCGGDNRSREARTGFLVVEQTTLRATSAEAGCHAIELQIRAHFGTVNGRKPRFRQESSGVRFGHLRPRSPSARDRGHPRCDLEREREIRATRLPFLGIRRPFTQRARRDLSFN